MACTVASRASRASREKADVADDRAVRRVDQRVLAAQERQILAVFAADPEFGPLTGHRPCPTRTQARDLCARALLGVRTP